MRDNQSQEETMELESFKYQLGEGWSVKNFPPLDSEQTLIVLFAAPEFINHPEPIQELARHYPHSKIIGCSSAGEIYGATVLDNSLTVAVARFEKTSLQIVKETVADTEDSFNAGKRVAQFLNLKENLRAIFVLSEGLKINGSELVKGLNSLASEQVVVTGGLAGDGKRFQQTWGIFNGEVCTNSVIAIGLYGDNIHIGHASRGGWDIFGPERRITRAEGNVLYELDNQPALKLYKVYLGEKADDLPAAGLLFPLAIRKDASDEKQLVRTILGVDEATQSLTFAGDMPIGYRARLMRANFDRLITSASRAGEVALENLTVQDNRPILAIAISCVGRRLLLGERTEEEIEALRETLPGSTQQIGFYSYGELSPYAKGTCDLHNQTMTITTLYES